MTGGPCSVVKGVDDQASGRLGLLEVNKYWSGVVSQSKSSSEVGEVEESSLPLSVRARRMVPNRLESNVIFKVLII